MSKKPPIALIVIALASVVGLGILVVAGGAWWVLKQVPLAPDASSQSRGPTIRYRQLVMIECDADGRVKYTVNAKTLGSEADLTAELRDLIPRVEFGKGDGIEVEFVILSVATQKGDSFTQEHLDRARAACRAAGTVVLVQNKPLPVAPVAVTLEIDDRGHVQYRVGSGEALKTEKSLREAVAELVRTRKMTTVRLTAEPLSGITESDVAAAKSACQAAGVAVDTETLPPPTPLEMAAAFRAGKRSADLKVKAVGVCDGKLQFRVDDSLVVGNDELAAAVRKRALEIEKEKGGFTCIYPSVSYADELVVSSGQSDAVSNAVFTADPQMFRGFGYRMGGGRRSSNVLKRVTVHIIAAHGKENRYELSARTLDGEEALISALREELAEWREGKEAARVYFLDVSVRVEVKPGITATEEQIALAHRTVLSAEVQRPPDRYVSVKISGGEGGGVRYTIADRTYEDDDALKAAVKALVGEAERNKERLVVKLEVIAGAEPAAAVIEAATNACLETGAAVQAPGR